jgi:tRNA (guanine-N7-)-methyltransferase
MDHMTDKGPPRRSIRSFVLRAGRITPAQERALTEAWPRYGIDPPVSGPQESSSATLDLAAAFGRRAPVVVEIGFGNGENLLALAAADPARDFLGIEVHRACA